MKHIITASRIHLGFPEEHNSDSAEDGKNPTQISYWPPSGCSSTSHSDRHWQQSGYPILLSLCSHLVLQGFILHHPGLLLQPNRLLLPHVQVDCTPTLTALRGQQGGTACQSIASFFLRAGETPSPCQRTPKSSALGCSLSRDEYPDRASQKDGKMTTAINPSEKQLHRELSHVIGLHSHLVCSPLAFPGSTGQPWVNHWQPKWGRMFLPRSPYLLRSPENG